MPGFRNNGNTNVWHPFPRYSQKELCRDPAVPIALPDRLLLDYQSDTAARASTPCIGTAIRGPIRSIGVAPTAHSSLVRYRVAWPVNGTTAHTVVEESWRSTPQRAASVATIDKPRPRISVGPASRALGTVGLPPSVTAISTP
jgi:hypothetical protein